ncbi:hypothetical protein Barb4_00212 [Bacteroidales bacterium Barb4]|nr:hypothetical protein Barb4_00212 [Bacteroidales bacterium Barb4]
MKTLIFLTFFTIKRRRAMNKYPIYKSSNIPWIGGVPEHWEMRYLSQICKEQLMRNTGNIETNVLSLSHGKIIQKKKVTISNFTVEK